MGGPDGCLCDAARPGWIFYKQGDGRVDIHDWGMEFTAAGVVLQAEALLIARDSAAITRYLPKLERCADFLETRPRSEEQSLPRRPGRQSLSASYAGWKKPDGTYDKAYLAGLSITTIAALDRLIELEKMAGRADKVGLYAGRRALSGGACPCSRPKRAISSSRSIRTARNTASLAPRAWLFRSRRQPRRRLLPCRRRHSGGQDLRQDASIPGLRPYDLIITNIPPWTTSTPSPRTSGSSAAG